MLKYEARNDGILSSNSSFSVIPGNPGEPHITYVLMILLLLPTVCSTFACCFRTRLFILVCIAEAEISFIQDGGKI
jgi:hypothetical protein